LVLKETLPTKTVVGSPSTAAPPVLATLDPYPEYSTKICLPSSYDSLVAAKAFLAAAGESYSIKAFPLINLHLVRLPYD
jgi:hypothetical protein